MKGAWMYVETQASFYWRKFPWLIQYRLLICSVKPYMAKSVLLETPGLKKELRGKLLISVLSGVKAKQLSEWLPETSKILSWIIFLVSHICSYNSCNAKYSMQNKIWYDCFGSGFEKAIFA